MSVSSSSERRGAWEDSEGVAMARRLMTHLGMSTDTVAPTPATSTATTSTESFRVISTDAPAILQRAPTQSTGTDSTCRETDLETLLSLSEVIIRLSFAEMKSHALDEVDQECDEDSLLGTESDSELPPPYQRCFSRLARHVLSTFRELSHALRRLNETQGSSTSSSLGPLHTSYEGVSRLVCLFTFHFILSRAARLSIRDGAHTMCQLRRLCRDVEKMTEVNAAEAARTLLQDTKDVLTHLSFLAKPGAANWEEAAESDLCDEERERLVRSIPREIALQSFGSFWRSACRPHHTATPLPLLSTFLQRVAEVAERLPFVFPAACEQAVNSQPHFSVMHDENVTQTTSAASTRKRNRDEK